MNYHPEMKLYATRRDVKKAFITVVDPINGNDCSNCGGVGRLSLFCAFYGPYQSPGNPYKSMPALGDNNQEVHHSLVNHFDEQIQMWWVGTTYTFECLDCGGSGIRQLQVYTQRPTQKYLGHLVHPHTGEILE